MKKILLLLIFPILVFSQNYELGKVTIAELNQKQHLTDTSAVAAILFNKGKTSFDFMDGNHFVLRTEVEVKIKIFKKQGLSWANKEIAYYVGNNAFETILIDKATTYNLVNGKIEKTKLTSDGEFKMKINENWFNKKITMPNVKEGSIIELRYTIKSPYLTNLQNWRFQETIPVDYSEYKTIIPEYYTYNLFKRGNVNLTTIKDAKYSNLSVLDDPTLFRAHGNREADKVSLNENITTISAKNVPAIVEEAYINSIENYVSNIQFQLSSIQFPNSKIQNISENWESVAKHLYDSANFGYEIKKNNYFDKEYENLLHNTNYSPVEKINVLYNFVKNHYKWNGRTDVNTDVGVNKAFKDKVGNVAEINFTLIAMLKKAGLNTNPVLLTTRDQALNLFPSITAFNYVICGVEIDGDVILLDATDKSLKPNLLPNRALNYVGRLIYENGNTLEINLSPKVHAKNTVMIYATVENTEISGSIKEILTENNALRFRNKYGHLSQESYLENVEKNRPGFEISEYVIENKNNEYEPLKEAYSFKTTNEVEKINDKLFFKPLLFFAMDENLFKQANRDFPVDFVFPTHDSYTITFNLPDGYEVETLPQKINIAMEDNIASFSFLIGHSNNKIQIVSSLIMNSSIVPAEYYEDLKAFYNQVYLKMNEKIVLKKL